MPLAFDTTYAWQELEGQSGGAGESSSRDHGMNWLAQIKARVGAPEPSRSPRIAVFGDSHSAALLRAQEFAERTRRYEHIRIFRLRKEKDGRSIGHTDLEGFCHHIARYDPEDFVFSAAGGNQYAVVSTVRHPLEFDFVEPGAELKFAQDAALVPFRAITGYIEAGVRGTVGPVLTEIRDATRARVFHLAPPPPKFDNAFIAEHFESRFAREGLQDFGPTRPDLRLKCWKAQLRCLERLCGELGVQLIMPPVKAVTHEGFLAPTCYAKDVTHANRRYGEHVLRQIAKLTGTLDRAEARSK